METFVLTMLVGVAILSLQDYHLLIRYSVTAGVNVRKLTSVTKYPG